MEFIKHFSEIDDADLPRVGGKGLNLGKLTRAGFPVPNGFCVTTEAYRLSVEGLLEQNEGSIKDIELRPKLIAEIRTAREKLRTPTFAVRSSATAEDLAEASFAGQQDTFLNVTPDELLDALKACWASLWSERAISYRQTQKITDEGLAMAVVIQEMCEADVSGVLFTVAPFNANAAIIESNWGLGESVVSGAITPDSFHVSRDTGEVLERSIATKNEMVTATGVSVVPSAQQDAPSLTDTQLKELTHLGMRVETHYRHPMDIEWALTDGQFVLLQSRHITTSPTSITPRRSELCSRSSEVDAAAVGKVRQEEIQILEARAEEQGTVWCHHNLAEVLPAPLPMTWEIMKKFMSGAGGLGKAYRGLGFYPSERVNTEGILDLICGRIYVNLNREAELHFDGFPFAHDFNALKRNPQEAMYAQAQTDITRSNTSFWVKLPLHIIRMSRAEMHLRQHRSDFARLLIEEIFPAFQKEVEAERNISYSDLTDTELVTKFEEWRAKTLDDFAPKALTATLLAGFSLQRLEVALQKCLNETETKILVNRLMSGTSDNLTDETVVPQASHPRLASKLSEVAMGDLTRTDFLKDYGHRAVDEFELAQPRWREDTTYLEQMIASLRSVGGTCNPDTLQPQIEQRESAEKELAVHLKNKTGLRKQVARELDFTRCYMPFRETAKFYLMLGYEQIRRALLELDRRYQLNGGIFYLVPDELRRLIDGEVFSDVITARKTKRELMLQIEVPDVIFSDALDQIGTATPLETVDTLTGVGVSAGIATGQARVLLTPTDVRPSDRNYILVCPSTDPAWTPLFLHAAGLVMERGGILSHGAVVAREYGVPAVANIPNATRRITEGQTLQVDGNQGTISIF
ncbi:MAG: PEP-utilizing enzyme [Candidatus Poribacteria bacterium]|nr:PEP-utilizing enzyme [Candidatus Poribacteria bacterium]